MIDSSASPRPVFPAWHTDIPVYLYYTPCDRHFKVSDSASGKPIGKC